MTNLKQYAELKRQIKELTAQAKSLEAIVADEVMAVDGEKVVTDYGTFSFTMKKVWIYSDELLGKELKAKESIKLLKKQEELKEIATLDKVKSSLRFQGK